MLNANESRQCSEAGIANRLQTIFDLAGSHSPSLTTLCNELPDISLRVDACFLSNPYAADLFSQCLMHDLREDPECLRRIVENYPQQNDCIARTLGQHLELPCKQIFVGNGATEIIQAVLQKFAGPRTLITLPTFSPYYEYVPSHSEVLFYQLDRERQFELDVGQFINFVFQHRPSTVCLINPNNPNGLSLPLAAVRALVAELAPVTRQIIVDQSFIHFVDDSADPRELSMADEVERHPNLVVVESLSKSYGIAGIRAGYAVMNCERVRELQESGFLWNCNGLAEYFYGCLARSDFQAGYKLARQRYVQECRSFFSELNTVTDLQVYPTSANFGLLELPAETSVAQFVGNLLEHHGVYIRNCSDKLGLNGKFVRVACRGREHDRITLKALRRAMAAPCSIEVR